MDSPAFYLFFFGGGGLNDRSGNMIFKHFSTTSTIYRSLIFFKSVNLAA